MQTIAILPEETAERLLYRAICGDYQATGQTPGQALDSLESTLATTDSEYCHAPEIISNVAFEVDHTTPLSKGGFDELENLALACRICNLRKSDHMDAVDSLTQLVLSLFNPRQHQWSEILKRLSNLPIRFKGKRQSVVPLQPVLD
jgi:5-methylcytosine-specific restriction endonuclease McrA